MDSARKMAEEALAEIAAGDHGEYCGLRNGMLLSGGKTECYSDCPKRVAKEALEALLAAGPEAPPPPSDAVREAAEALLDDYAGVEDMLLPDTLEKVLRLRAALRANASPAPGSEGVREAEAVLAEAREALDEIRRRSTDKLAGGIAASFLGAHPRAALRGGQKGEGR